MGDVLNIRLKLAGAKEPYNYFMLQCGPTSADTGVCVLSEQSCLSGMVGCSNGRGQGRGGGDLCILVCSVSCRSCSPATASEALRASQTSR